MVAYQALNSEKKLIHFERILEKYNFSPKPEDTPDRLPHDYS